MINFDNDRQNLACKKLRLSQGTISSIKPILKCFLTFPNLKKLELSHLALGKIHLMALDTYIVQNSCLKSLKLVGVRLNLDGLRLLSGSLELSKSLSKLNLS